MALRSLRPHLSRELRRYTSLYEGTRTRAPAFAAYPQAENAADALVSAGPEERVLVLRGCLAEYQAHPHALWSSLLLLGSMPLLQGLRHRAVAAHGDWAGLDCLITVSYLEAAAAVPLSRVHRGTGIVLARLCQWRVSQSLRVERSSVATTGDLPRRGESRAPHAVEDVLIEWLDERSKTSRAHIKEAVAEEYPFASEQERARAFERRRKAIDRARAKSRAALASRLAA